MSRFHIPEEVIDEIRERVSIERVIGEYVPLKKRGKYFVGKCPFHKETSPSFHVNPQLQIFKCFGCGESGNVITFLMKFESVSFLEVIERLARQTGIDLPEHKKTSPEDKSEKAKLIRIMKNAAEIYQKFLLNAPEAENARTYLDQRGFDHSLIKKYSIGYAPESWDFIIKKLNMPLPLLQKAGLVIEKKVSGRCYDRFRNRVLFPIREIRQGHIVAFGGRTLGDDPAKYINSPESKIYNKSAVLYGYYESLKSIRNSRTAILVEGYFDRLALDRAGITNAIAPCGTSFTEQQVRLLKRSAELVYLLFDADAAGISAAKRAMEMCLGSGLETKAAIIQAGKDPDDVVKNEGREGIQHLLDNAIPAIDFLIESSTQRHDLSRSAGRKLVVEEMIPFLMEVPNSIDRGSYISRIADLVGVPAESVMELLRRSRLRALRGNRGPDKNIDSQAVHDSVQPMDLMEKELFIFFIQNPEYFLWEGNPLKCDSMFSGMAKFVFEIFNEELQKKNTLDVSRISEKIQDPNMRNAVVNLFDDPDMEQRIINEDPAVIFQSLTKAFETRKIQNEISDISRLLKSGKLPPEEAEKLFEKQMNLLKSLEGIKSS